MKLSLYTKLARRNIKANYRLQIPFVIASGLMFAMLYIMSSMIQNDYVQTRHSGLTQIITFGTVITCILCAIFLVYGQSFIHRRRNKEFALYSILGFDKKHISGVILVEQIINIISISVLAIVGGQLIGALFFKLLNNILKDTSAGIGDYPWSISASLIVIVGVALCVLGTYVWQLISIHLINPIALMQKEKSGEKHTKFTVLLGVMGIIALVSGYYLALTTVGLIESINTFFIAVLLVMFATHMIFTSVIALVLKRMQKNKRLYYQPAQFLSISGMLYRMKSNAASLANIAILSTGIMLALGTTISIYNGIENTLGLTMKADYKLVVIGDDEAQRTFKEETVYQQDLFQKVKAIDALENAKLIAMITGQGMYHHQTQTFEVLPQNPTMTNSQTIFYLDFQLIDNYNHMTDLNESLADNEIIVNDIDGKLKDIDTLTLAGKVYQVKHPDKKLESPIVIDYAQIVLPTNQAYQEISEYYMDSDSKVVSQNFEIIFDSTLKPEEIKQVLDQQLEGLPYGLKSKDEEREQGYQLNGGFLFLGILLGMIMLIGTVLMIYYKQITEGYEDKENFRIMKQVGLPDSLIRQTIRKQTLWLFILPMIMAIIHGAFASKIIFNLLAMFGIREWSQFLIPYITVIIVFAMVYYIVYKITSHVYYDIVNE